VIIRLRLELEKDEYEALMKVAINELRAPGEQALWIVRQELSRRGLLHLEPHIHQSEKNRIQ
jgi:hypothetical protein